MNYEFNLLHNVGVVAKKVCAAAAAAEMTHEGDDNTPTGQGVKMKQRQVLLLSWLNTQIQYA